MPPSAAWERNGDTHFAFYKNCGGKSPARHKNPVPFNPALTYGIFWRSFYNKKAVTLCIRMTAIKICIGSGLEIVQQLLTG